MSTEAVLVCQGLVKTFGGIIATDHVDLRLHRGERHALIGPNGAGKTTLVHLLTGVDRKSTRLNSSHSQQSRMPSSA